MLFSLLFALAISVTSITKDFESRKASHPRCEIAEMLIRIFLRAMAISIKQRNFKHSSAHPVQDKKACVGPTQRRSPPAPSHASLSMLEHPHPRG
jgi:hypothetical protein